MKSFILFFVYWGLFFQTSKIFAATSVKQVDAGNNHVCALLMTGEVKCWGGNQTGALGAGDNKPRGDRVADMGARLLPVDLGTTERVVSLNVNSFQSCALFEEGRMKCWGDNRFGQLGLGDVISRGDALGEMGKNLPFIDLGTNQKILSVSVGGNHACAILDGYRLKCWGRNSDGQLGLGDNLNRGIEPNQMGDQLPYVNLGTDEKALRVQAGDLHTCVLLLSGKVKCFGRNNIGQLGLGDTQPRGLLPGQMGDNLPVVQLGTALKAINLFLSSSHTCVLLENKKIKCWGNNNGGQLGLGDTQNRGDTAEEMGDALPFVNLGSGEMVVGLSLNGNQGCAQLINNTLKCWGNNNFGQLGIGNNLTKGDEADEMGGYLQTVYVGSRKNVVSSSVGTQFACAVIGNPVENGVKCWGRNILGQLGIENDKTIGLTMEELGDNLGFVAL
ncbi:MAG: RCC1 domain-containing protein [Bdellovibrionales bacterium]